MCIGSNHRLNSWANSQVLRSILPLSQTVANQIIIKTHHKIPQNKLWTLNIMTICEGQSSMKPYKTNTYFFNRPYAMLAPVEGQNFHHWHGVRVAPWYPRGIPAGSTFSRHQFKHIQWPQWQIWLVVQLFHLEKYEFVNGKDDIPYKWKINIKVMFETPTSQKLLANYVVGSVLGSGNYSDLVVANVSRLI